MPARSARTTVVGGRAEVAVAQRTDGEAGVRRFGYWAGHFAVVGSMVGAGVLTTSGTILRETGNPGALLALWALGGALALCGAVTVAELATALPRHGGDYLFVREAFGRGAGFVSGWATFTLGFAAPTAVVAHLALTYLTTPYSAALAESLPPWAAANLVPLGASALILSVGVTHSLGHRHSSWLQGLATLATAGLLVALAAGGILFGRGDWGHLSAGGWPAPRQWPVLAVGLIYVGYSYAGWNAAGYLAGEIRDPARTLPRCLVGGAATVTALYLLVNLAFVYALDPAAVKGMRPEEVRPVAELAARALFGPAAARLVGAALGLCLVAAVSAFVLTGPRVAFAMARDGVFPGFAARLHPTRGTPAAATLALAAVSAALVWAGSFLELLDYASVGLAALSGLTVASVFPLRRRAGLAHPYRLPLYPLPPLAFLALTVGTIGSALADERSRLPGLLSLATLLVGVPLSRLVVAPQRRTG
jgi:APA family basic amino acid/polyamine antiporter